MGFFRDVARIKARNRRHENDKALGIVRNDKAAAAAASASRIDDLKLLFLGIEEDIFMGLSMDGNTNSTTGTTGTTSSSCSSISSASTREDESGEDEKGSGSDEDLVVYTRQELYDYGNAYSNINSNNNNNNDEEEEQDENEEPKQQLLISIFGRVYDVSAGNKFYGPGGRYEQFSGHDITYALSTGCVKPSCIHTIASMNSILGNEENDANGSTDEEIIHEEEKCNMVQMTQDIEDDEKITCSVVQLSEKELKEGKKWLHFFETHDSYMNVGVLEEGIPMEQLMDSIIDSDISSASNDGGDNDGE